MMRRRGRARTDNLQRVMLMLFLIELRVVCIAVSPGGFEPPATGLSDRCSTWLSYGLSDAPHRGIEPLTSPRQGDVIPFHQCGRFVFMEPVTGVEPASSDYKTGALPLSYTGGMVPHGGIEPLDTTLKGSRVAITPMGLGEWWCG